MNSYRKINDVIMRQLTGYLSKIFKYFEQYPFGKVLGGFFVFAILWVPGVMSLLMLFVLYRMVLLGIYRTFKKN